MRFLSLSFGGLCSHSRSENFQVVGVNFTEDAMFFIEFVLFCFGLGVLELPGDFVVEDDNGAERGMSGVNFELPISNSRYVCEHQCIQRNITIQSLLCKKNLSPYLPAREIKMRRYLKSREALIANPKYQLRLPNTQNNCHSQNINNHPRGLHDLVRLYLARNQIELARHLFDQIPNPNVVLWNMMIRAYAWTGPFHQSIHLYHRMLQLGLAGIAPNSSTIVSILPTIGQANALCQGKTVHAYSVRKIFSHDVVVATGLLDMYAKCHHLSYAQKIFNALNQKNEICWSAMIGGYVICDSMRDALALYDDMVYMHGLNPTPVILASTLRACANLTDLNKGKNLHCYMIKSGINSDTTVGNSLISMYAKCGTMDDALGFLDEMVIKDSVSYSAIISGCVQNGYAEKAVLIFRKMQLSGTDPDSATMIGNVLYRYLCLLNCSLPVASILKIEE
ncbi:hypothetical protein V8G54_006640 [Vigna mungo]|uniref:Pentatricopeptide repeat-containing protein n=1 Tax=Vigna mungo TaxID=3915 RepID=A0AAQ3P0U5_VIGMU